MNKDFDDDFISELMETASAPACGPASPEDGGRPVDFSAFSQLGEAGEALVGRIRETGKNRATLIVSRRHLTLLMAAVERVCERQKTPLPRKLSEFEAMIPAIFAELSSSPKYENQGFREDCYQIRCLLVHVVEHPILIPDVPRLSMVRKSWRALDEGTARRLLAAAREDVAVYVARHRRFSGLTPGVWTGKARSCFMPRDRDGLIEFWITHLGAVVNVEPSSGVLARRWLNDQRRPGIPVRTLYAGLFPRLDDIIPFIVILLIQTPLNLSDLLNLDTAWLAEGPDGMGLVHEKNRSNSTLFSQSSARELDVELKALFRDVIDITKQSRPLVSTSDQNRLWLFRTHHLRDRSLIHPLTMSNWRNYYDSLYRWAQEKRFSRQDVSALATFARKRIGRNKYNSVIERGFGEVAALKATAAELGQVKQLLYPYAHACISDGEAVRVVRGFTANIMSILSQYRM